jgi:hypothetical protein
VDIVVSKSMKTLTGLATKPMSLVVPEPTALQFELLK